MTSGGASAFSGDLEPLPTAAAAVLVAGVASFVWPEMDPAVLCLAIVASFAAWVRAVRAVRERRTSGYDSRRVFPLAGVGIVGWAGALFASRVSPDASTLGLILLAIALWLSARSAGVSR